MAKSIVPHISMRHHVAPVVVAGLSIALGAGPVAVAAPKPIKRKPRILLVHGAFADGSSWDGVIRNLRAGGYTVVASQIPLTSFADDVAAVQRDLRVLGGPTLVVGHSYAGAVITQAAEDSPNVIGLVYVAAVAPDTGETATVFDKLAPPLPSEADVTPIDLPHVGEDNAPFVIIRRDRFAADFCQDCSAPEKELLAASEVPTNASAFAAPITGTPAWRQFPSWYQISRLDRIINPRAQRIMARRVDPTGRHTIALRSSHASPISHARQVAQFIEHAATASGNRHGSSYPA
jgi:pimeloyl-ACP methyl ester carboxylesterase